MATGERRQGRRSLLRAAAALLATGLGVMGLRRGPGQAAPAVSGGAAPQAGGGFGFLGEIRMFAGNFAPVDWALCDGSLQWIINNPALFSILGTTYGGDGESTFALPNLQSSFAIGAGTGLNLSNYQLGQTGGTERSEERRVGKECRL